MTLISDHFASYRRLFESQDYMMRCLTRMYHLRDTEQKRYINTRVYFLKELMHTWNCRTVQPPKCVVEVQPPEADKFVSPDTVLLVDEPDNAKVIWSLNGGRSHGSFVNINRNLKPDADDIRRRSVTSENDSHHNFPRLHFKDSAASIRE